MLNGIDISKWQQGIDIRSVDADFVVCQACFGSSAQPTFTSQIEATLNAGKKAGAYIFITGADGEISAFCSLVKPYVGRAVLALDWEADNNGAWGNLSYLRSCIREVQNTTGVTPMVYFPASAYGQIKPVLDQLNAGAWVAQYATTNPTGYQSSPWNEQSYDMAMFQYSSNGRIVGYGGALDLDLFYGDGAAWDAYAKSSHDQPKASLAWTEEEVIAFSNAVEGNRSYYIRTGDGMYLGKDGASPAMVHEPYI
ncbi:MAG: glycoside hydrolase, partial [Aeriscardovia sp.]|nr:glycoside hydrolase [Aeriscardovia sp.]